MHGVEVGEHATQPPVGHVRHAHSGGLLFHTFLRLLLGADEQHRSAVSHGLTHKLIGSIDARERTLQIDDVDTVALRHDEAIHFGIPAPSLVTKVHTGLEQLTNCDDSHDTSFQRRSAARSVTASTRCASPWHPYGRFPKDRQQPHEVRCANSGEPPVWLVYRCLVLH